MRIVAALSVFTLISSVYGHAPHKRAAAVSSMVAAGPPPSAVPVVVGPPVPSSAVGTIPTNGPVPIGGIRGTNQWPDTDLVPRVDDPQVIQWLSEIDLTGVPTWPTTNQGNCPPAGTFDPATCWWTCQKCVRPSDILFCPQVDTWGLTYDDGPTHYTPRLLDFMGNNSIHSTFFLVGSRCSEYTALVKQEVDLGHQVAVHTWSHHALTSLTNEEIVAEIKWTEKCIFDAAGVIPTMMRPPYGDTDDRVRFILEKLGYQQVIWTDGFDTNDWQIPDNVGVTTASVLATFQSWLPLIPKLGHGFIVLEHDLWAQTVGVALKILPQAIAAKLNLQPVGTCMNLPFYKSGTLPSGIPAVSSVAVAGVPAGSQAASVAAPAASLASLASVLSSAVAAPVVASSASRIVVGSLSVLVVALVCALL
jgi:peptidoglycan/xylan/chitin deacetylase (PgdA/CDA1 family)